MSARMIGKLLIASATLLLVAAPTIEANARPYGYARHGGRGFAARRPNYAQGLGLRKQTRTGGPAGGSTNGGGGS